MTCSPTEIFCDWLDTTYSPDSPVIDSTKYWAQSHGAMCFFSDDKVSSYRFGGEGTASGADNTGVLRFETAKHYSKISASGQVLAYLRSVGLFMDYLSEVSDDAHNVSRIDVSMDLPLDGAGVISKLRRKFSGGTCQLGRKSLPVQYQLGVNSAGRETGTFYAGHRTKARTTAAIYDKAWEAFQKRGEQLPPTTRYEMRMKSEKGRAGASLRDAAEPERLFWHIASPTLLKAPKGVEAWSSGWDGGWHYERPDKLLPAEVLARRIDFSPDLDSLIEVADSMGSGGRAYLLRLLERKVSEGNLLDS
jgi:hypothetical protein